MKRLAVVVMAGVLATGGFALAAQPAAADPPVTCGLWGDQSGPNHLHYGNCSPNNVELLVHTWVGSNRTECALANSTKDLGNGFNIRTAEPDGKSCQP
jgi:hypothetical protein